MKTLIATILTVGVLTIGSPAQAEPTCAAITPECGYPDAPEPVLVHAPLPAKCWCKHYRRHHHRRCVDYPYWHALVGEAR